MYRYERRYTLGYFSLNSTHIQNTYDCFMYAFYVISVWDALIQLSCLSCYNRSDAVREPVVVQLQRAK